MQACIVEPTAPKLDPQRHACAHVQLEVTYAVLHAGIAIMQPYTLSTASIVAPVDASPHPLRQAGPCLTFPVLSLKHMAYAAMQAFLHHHAMAHIMSLSPCYDVEMCYQLSHGPSEAGQE